MNAESLLTLTNSLSCNDQIKQGYHQNREQHVVDCLGPVIVFEETHKQLFELADAQLAFFIDHQVTHSLSEVVQDPVVNIHLVHLLYTERPVTHKEAYILTLGV